MKGTLTLMGSGEMTPGMAKVHRLAINRISGDVVPAFLDTPAGFELNCDGISAKARDYFAEHFALNLEIASFRNANTVPADEVAKAMQTLRRANYIFSGPGSPTYAVQHWRATPVFETVAAKLQSGAQVTFASAAALALGAFTLPVYEIYKVGAEPHWLEGLDLLGRLGFNLAVLPHWNNNSGGNHDTTRCFVGQARFDVLYAMLPKTAVVLGIDEYTACTLDLDARVGTVHGAGGVTVIDSAETRVFQNGQTFPLQILTGQRAPDAPHMATHRPLGASFWQALQVDQDPATALSALHILMDHLARNAHDPQAEAQSTLMIREMMAHLAVWLESRASNPGAAGANGHDPAAPWIDLLVALRAELRAAKQYALGDELRKRVAQLGVQIEDGPTGSTWRR
jgi:hypothetical protein